MGSEPGGHRQAPVDQVDGSAAKFDAVDLEAEG